MTFSEFLKTLETYYGRFAHPYFKKDASGTPIVADFVREIFIAATLDKDEPFKDASLPQKLFSGNNKISGQLAKSVLSNLSKDDFMEFLSNLDADDSLVLLAGSFGVTYTDSGSLFAVIFEVFKGFLTSAAGIKPLARVGYEEAAAELAPLFPSFPASKLALSAKSFFGSHVPAKEFVNREAPCQMFYDTLDGKLKQKIIMYYGIGGIGKSSLVKNLKEYTKKQGLLYSSVDFDDPASRTPYRASIELEKNLKVPLPHFDIAITLCFLKRNPDSLSGDIGLPSAVSREAIRLHRSSIKRNGIDETNGLINQLYSSNTLQPILVAEMQEHLNAIEDASPNDIEESLPNFFAYDLANYLAASGHSRCVLFFDTYELLWHNKHSGADKIRYDEWIRKLAEQLDTAIFVLSGREKVDWQMVDVFWDNQISLVSLELLSSDFALKYLDVCEIFEPEIRENIIAASQGHPYYLDLCVDTYYKLKNANRSISPEQFGKGYAEIQERFFRSLMNNEIDTLKVLSIPRFYDLEIFKYLVNEYQTSYALVGIGDFNALSFIKRDENGKFYIHILMREEIAKHINRDLKNDINSKMAVFYDRKLSASTLTVEDVKFLFAELIYHLNHTVADDVFLRQIESSYIPVIKRLQLSGETRYVLEEFREMFDNNYKQLSGTEFFAVMVDMIHLSGEYKRAVEIIEDYLSAYSIEQIASDKYALSLYIRKAHHRMFYTPVRELKYDLKLIVDKVNRTFNAAIYGEILFMLGAHIYLPLGDFEQSMKYLKEANQIAERNNLPGLLCRGLRKFSELMCAKGKFQEAERICKTAINIAKTNSLWRYEMYLRCVLGEVFRLTDRISEALGLFDEAMPIASSLGIKGWVGHIYLAIGNCHADSGNHNVAQEYYEKARDTYEGIGQKWGVLNLEVAYQRSLAMSEIQLDKGELLRLKTEANKLGYKVLSSKIDGLLSGELDPIRFEYL